MLKRAIWPLPNAINNILHHFDPELINKQTIIYFRDLNDRLAQIIDTTDALHDAINSIFDVYINNRAERLNQEMKMLTIVATIFIPATWISGVFGMNFLYMPFLESSWGFPLSLLCMAVSGTAILLFFRRKK